MSIEKGRLSITIRVSQVPYRLNSGPWERRAEVIAVPRVGECVCVEDYSWGCHIGWEGVEVMSVIHDLLTREIIVVVQDIEDRETLHSVDGSTWTEMGSKYWEEGDQEGDAKEREVLIGFTKCKT